MNGVRCVVVVVVGGGGGGGGGVFLASVCLCTEEQNAEASAFCL